MSVDFSRRPMLVFWETTRACALRCRHCRASAMPEPLPGELDAREGRALVEQVAAFGRPHPILVFTGGDCLARRDVFELVHYVVELGVHPAMSPSVTPNLDPGALARIRQAGVNAISISLDGAREATHDQVRGIPGHFADTVRTLERAVAAGFRVQVNTAVMRENVDELPDLAALLHMLGIHIWEVFFLVVTGRAAERSQLQASECEEVCHLLYDASGYGLTVRTVEAPFFRRVAAWRRARPQPGPAEVATAFDLRGYYRPAAQRLRALLGEPGPSPAAHTVSTRDGSGIIFIAHNGDVYPAGFMPLSIGNVRDRPLAEIYRDDLLLQAIRRGDFSGRCGACEYRELCGGSRSRALATTGDPLAEDPACAYQPVAGGPV